jgi:hypothetical protein
VILPDELGAAIAQEVQSMLLRRPGRVPQDTALSEVLSTPLDRLIEGSITDMRARQRAWPVQPRALPQIRPG